MPPVPSSIGDTVKGCSEGVITARVVNQPLRIMRKRDGFNHFPVAVNNGQQRIIRACHVSKIIILCVAVDEGGKPTAFQRGSAAEDT
jgi:hypothetical protein